MMLKSTGLSRMEADLLETLLAKHGEVVVFEDIFFELKDQKSRQQIRNLASKLTQSGWLVRLKKGVYCIASLESRGSTALSVFTIAYYLEKDSYVSLEAALQYYGMFDQLLRTITLLSLKERKGTKIGNTEYNFIHTNEKNFYGWEDNWEGSHKIRIATAEKALLDLLTFRRSSYTIDLVEEKLREYGRDLDWKKMIALTKRQTVRVQRIVGFLLDRLQIDTVDLLKQVAKHKGASFMTKDSKHFNAKWRLYYHNHFI